MKPQESLKQPKPLQADPNATTSTRRASTKADLYATLGKIRKIEQIYTQVQGVCVYREVMRHAKMTTTNRQI